MKFSLSIVVLLFALPAFTQNLTGTWVGRANPNDYIRLEIIHVGDSLYGMAYDEGGGGFCRTDFAGSFKVSGQRLRGRTENFIDRTANHSLTDYSMRYEKQGDAEYLNGIVRPRSTLAKILTLGLGTPALLRKESNRVDTTAFMKAHAVRPPAPSINPDTIAVIPPPAVEKKDTPVIAKPVTPPPVVTVTDSMLRVKDRRSSPVISTITTDADSVRLLIYDEGVVDGDSITVFVNNVMVLNNFLITDRPGELKLAVNKTTPVEVVLVANNLGSIPPNTSLVIILAGTARHEIRAAYDLNANARIIIQYKE